MGVGFTIKRIVRVGLRILLYTFLLTLPVTIFPLLAGIEGGITFQIWNFRLVMEHVNAFFFEVDNWQFRNYFNLPGGEGLNIHDFFDNRAPFHIPLIRSLGWLEKLGVAQPLEFDTSRDGSIGVDKIAVLDGLVRDASALTASEAQKLNSRYWIYVTEIPEFRGDMWDQAFEEIVEELYVKPLPNDTGLYQLDCGESGFLCGIWAVEAPSLVHVAISDRSVAELETEILANQEKDHQGPEAEWMFNHFMANFSYSSPKDVLYPAIVRVVELPLKDNFASSLLSRTTLPTPSNQLRTILLDPDQDAILSHFNLYDQAEQYMHRFQDYHDALVETRNSYHFYFNELDKWWSDTVLEPIFGKKFTGNEGFMSSVQSITFIIAAYVASFGVVSFNFVRDIYRWFVGIAWDGQPEDTIVPLDLLDQGAGQGLAVGSNFMVDMFAGFWEWVGRNISAEASESAAHATITEM